MSSWASPFCMGTSAIAPLPLTDFMMATDCCARPSVGARVGQIIMSQAPVPWEKQPLCQIPARFHKAPIEATMLLFA